jgi:hypothetical protein
MAYVRYFIAAFFALSGALKLYEGTLEPYLRQTQMFPPPWLSSSRTHLCRWSF